ncbi:MAG: ComEC/Rec2 family competence protein [Peptostreptococcaceae bacterium]
MKNIRQKFLALTLCILFIFNLTGCGSKEIDAQTNTEINNELLESEIHFIDTGNSDAILIKNNGKYALVDGGDNDDENRVVSYLQQQGVKELEYIFATHPHADHIGGLDAVIDSFKVKKVLVSNGDSETKTYSDFIYSLSNKGLSPSVPLLNSEFKLGSSKFKVISVANEHDPNNNSLVLMYTNGNDKILLMGDAEAKIEKQLKVEKVDLIKVGHHGSSSSSNESFIDKANPEYAVILVGENNKYGHPHKETMSLLKDKNIEVHRSDECGDIIFKSSGDGLSVDCIKGSYTANKGENTTTNNKPSNNKPKEEVKLDEGTSSDDNIVYWTPNGKSYHTTKNCSTLSRSKVINSSTISQSGKNDPCDRCN